MMNGESLAARALHLSLTALIVTAIFVRPTVFQQAISERRLFAPILYIFSAICSIVLYFVVSCMDPGYVKKDDADVEPLEVIVDDEAGGSNDEDASLFQVKHDKNNDSVKFNLKPHQRCGFCRLKKPMRAKHCRDCKRCVRRFDHHCFWMANCVGERNHKFFLLFITSELALLVWSFSISLSGFVKPADGEEWISVNLLLVIADIFIGVFVFVTFILFTMHTYSAFTNNTTWESISKQRIPYLSKLTANPFDMGFCRNFYLFCCVCRAQDWTKYYENAKSNLLKKTTTTTTGGGGYRKLETPARGHEFSDDDDDGEETTFSREQLHTSLQVENEQS